MRLGPEEANAEIAFAAPDFGESATAAVEVRVTPDGQEAEVHALVLHDDELVAHFRVELGPGHPGRARFLLGGYVEEYWEDARFEVVLVDTTATRDDGDWYWHYWNVDEEVWELPDPPALAHARRATD